MSSSTTRRPPRWPRQRPPAAGRRGAGNGAARHPRRPPRTAAPVDETPQELGAAETEVTDSEPATERRRAARGDELGRPPDRRRDRGPGPRALLPVVLGPGRPLGAPAPGLLLAHGRRAARDPQGADRLGRAPRRAHRRRAGGDPVRHLHRHRVGGDRRARRALPGGDGAVRARGLVVEPGRRSRRLRARLVRGRGLRVDAGGGVDRRDLPGHGRARASGTSADRRSSARTSSSRRSSPRRPPPWCAGSSWARRCSPPSSRCTAARGSSSGGC